MDYGGLALIAGGVGLSVFGFQQSALWGWSNPAIWASIAVGVILLVVFVPVERRTESPLINVAIFANRTFTVENLILGVAMMAFIPVFFFAAIYGQIALAEKATRASLAIIMAAATLVALRGLRRGVQEEPESAGTRLSDSVIGE